MHDPGEESVRYRSSRAFLAVEKFGTSLGHVRPYLKKLIIIIIIVIEIVVIRRDLKHHLSHSPDA